jgi:metal-responsive CopG/Arc/MetJ family transcriptional regulator
MSARPVSKITISLPSHLIDLADQLAEEQASSRSAVIAALLQREEKARIEALMEEGYREWAEENRRLAEEAFPIAAEVVLRDG